MIVGMLALFAGRASAESGGADAGGDLDISKILFHHVLNNNELELIPGMPPIILPFGITVHLLMIWLAVALIAVLFYLNFRKRNLKIRGFAVVLESLVLFVRDDIVYPVMGEKRGKVWLPFFVTLFLFILVVNMLGLIPAFKSATGNINVTTALALMILALIIIIGIKNLGVKLFFANMYPDGTPKAIGLFVTFLEVFGTFIKAMVLSLRLFANMFAGHLAILSFLVLIFILGPVSSLIAVPFTVFTYSLEVLVALIQALVFTLLSCIFIVLASSSHSD
jgi:F-type H+-transporting ATPase subunit a